MDKKKAHTTSSMTKRTVDFTINGRRYQLRAYNKRSTPTVRVYSWSPVDQKFMPRNLQISVAGELDEASIKHCIAVVRKFVGA